MIGRAEGDKLVGEQIVVECRRIRGPVLIHKTGAHRAQRIVAYGFPAEAWITRKWRMIEKT
ncbi:MAG: hypothetical protein FGF50_10440 [Candidatus Brockarchaeota archaeon]|nr:hypothetical protein [Candidatus Brockarchaeota archaeon]